MEVTSDDTGCKAGNFPDRRNRPSIMPAGKREVFTAEFRTAAHTPTKTKNSNFMFFHIVEEPILPLGKQAFLVNKAFLALIHRVACGYLIVLAIDTAKTFLTVVRLIAGRADPAASDSD